MKKTCWVTGVSALLAAIPFFVISCSGGGGGGEETAWDLAGRWNYALTVTGASCGGISDEADQVTVSQSGNNITAVTDDGITWTGAIHGDTLELSFERALAPDCVVRGEITLQIWSNSALRGNGNDRVNGSGCGAADGCTALFDISCDR